MLKPFKPLFSSFSTLKFSLSRRATISPSILYSTIATTSLYSTFLPWCTSSTSIPLSPTSNSTLLTVQFGFYNVSYNSLVTYQQPLPNVKTIRSLCKQSPFKVIDSIWRIEQIKDNLAQIGYIVEFQFENRIYQQAAGMFLEKIGEGMYQKFVGQALRKQREMRGKNNLEVFLEGNQQLRKRLEGAEEGIIEDVRKVSLRNQYKEEYASEMIREIQNILKRS